MRELRAYLSSEDVVEPDHLTAKQESLLQTFLAAPERPEGTLRCEELGGFFFGMLGGPALIPPSQWMPVVFGQGEADYHDMDEANAVVGALMAHYNTMAVTVGADRLVTLDDVGLNSDSEETLRPWSRGFVRGYGLVRDAWDDALKDLDEDEAERFETIGTILTIWADAAMYKELNELNDSEMKRMLTECRKAFVSSLNYYASLGLTIYRETHLRPQGASVKQPHRPVGRNDPCPCGSGKKYKKCCLN
jgi:uncharacterized protein